MLMAFVARAPSKVTKLKLIKWLFIAATEHKAAEHVPFYDFLPYQYGPFSFAAYYELDRLSRRGFLVTARESVTVGERLKVDNAIGTLTAAASNLVDDVLRDFGKLGNAAIVSRVYAQHPWYASRSKLRRVTKTPTAKPAVYTCGYEGASIDAFLNKLLRTGIRRIIDVRANAYSQKYGFTGGVLRALCRKVGIEYTHVPQLGVPSELRTDLKTATARNALFAHYRTAIVPAAEQAQQQVAELAAEGSSAMLCFEANARDCHRGALAPFIAHRTGLQIVHL
jgi:uncharacterized protein (DUF488 family)